LSLGTPEERVNLGTYALFLGVNSWK
jgi:hypothetical protein